MRASSFRSRSPELTWEEESVPTESIGISPFSDLSDTLGPSPEILFGQVDVDFFPEDMPFDYTAYYYEDFHGMDPTSSPCFDDTPPLALWPSPSSNPPRTSEVWACQECDKKFHNKKALMKHTRCHVKPFLCSTCPMGFSFAKDLRRHELSRGHGGQSPTLLLRCSECPFKFKPCRKDSYKRHLRLVHGTKNDSGKELGRKSLQGKNHERKQPDANG
ncbi:hypothetical protein B0J18DRAFT_146823 [Chaetomium sp. MPI-SDFR-AT-0129]|nr:hypothetical protein B0J18DRAFT_146823 [Chaetomium sp. MPI-SDFR-AT-0129]